MKDRKTNSFSFFYSLLSKKHWMLGMVLGAVLIGTSCYEVVEGCLDQDATNFALDADRACGDCCDFPEVSIRFSHQWDDGLTSVPFSYGTGYQDGGAHPFSINRITFYLKDFALKNKAGELIYPADSITVFKLNGGGEAESTNIRDDYLLINPSVSAGRDVGTVLRSATFTELHFVVGVNAETDLILPSSLPTNHPLSLLDTTMYDLENERYFSNRIEVLSDTTENAPLRTITYGSEQGTIPITIDIPGGFALPPGFNMEIEVEVNYASWFLPIQNIATDPENSLIDGIVGGVPFSFRLLEITAN